MESPMPKPVPELTDHLGYWLRLLSNHVSHGFARKVAGEGVTVAEWAMMRVMYGIGPLAPSRVAELMGMTRGAITRLADRLIAKGLMRREASETDGRAQTLRLTAKAERLVPGLAALADRNDAEAFAQLTGEERRALRAILEKSVERLGISRVAID
jgi:DNA-binding MarR family transcriptional regulator